MAMFVKNRWNRTPEEVHVQTERISTNPDFVIEVQADGHELERCLWLLRMKAPCREDGKALRVVKFYGEQAQFIVGNW